MQHLPLSLRDGDNADGSPHVQLQLLFDSARHGGSSAAMLRAAEASELATLVLVCTREGERFGAFVDAPWSMRSAQRGVPFFGGSGCFLFRLESERGAQAAAPSHVLQWQSRLPPFPVLQYLRVGGAVGTPVGFGVGGGLEAM